MIILRHNVVELYQVIKKRFVKSGSGQFVGITAEKRRLRMRTAEKRRLRMSRSGESRCGETESQEDAEKIEMKFQVVIVS